ncbi:MAG: 50S ribosomal protein L18e [Candidatus Woesearchaeota archaeon]
MKDNIHLQSLIQDLNKQSAQERVQIWKRIALDLSKPTRQRRVVNLYKLSRYAKEGETLVVPGKVLGTGEVNEMITVAAWDYSAQALEKLKNSKSIAMSIQELMKKNPKGSKVRIIG